MEIWKDIPGQKNYQASSSGNIRSLDRIVSRADGRLHKAKGRILIPGVNGAGYYGMRLGRGNPCMVHQLVALAFHGPAPEGVYVCHNDGDRANNTPSNLRYASPAANQADRALHGTAKVGSKLPHSKLNEGQVEVIKSLLGSKSQRAIGEMFGVCAGTVGTIARGVCWKHVKLPCTT